MKRTQILLTSLALVIMSGITTAQTLTDIGGAPTPGPNDISQLLTDGNTAGNQPGGRPEGLNYYIDNGNNPGQSFITGSNPGGYVLTSVAFQTGGLDSGGGGTGPQAYRLRINQYTNATAVGAPLLSFNSPATFVFTDGDWLQVTDIALLLQPNTKYTYAFRRNTAGWCALAVATNTGYANGEIALVPTGGGTVIVGAAHLYDAPFVIGLSTNVVAAAPVATPNPAYALSQVTITEAAAGPGVLSYQWRTDGGGGGSLTNIPGATSAGLVTFPPDQGVGYTINFDVVVTSSTSGSVTSAPVVLSVLAASGPFLTQDTTPNPVVTYAGANVTFNAAFDGTSPITYNWQTDAGQTGTFTNIPGATTPTLVLTGVQTNRTGNYRLSAANVVGTAASTPASLTVGPLIYREVFNSTSTGDQPIANVGWRNDVVGLNTRRFGGLDGAVYSYRFSVGPEAFYATTSTANGSITNHMPFPNINLATTANLRFHVDLFSGFAPNIVHSYFAVQMNFGNWYVSTTELTQPAANNVLVNSTMVFDPTAAGWNDLTVSGTGSVDNPAFPTIGAAAAGDLAGFITGAGIVSVHDGNSTHNFDNFVMTGNAVPPTKPVINSPPFSRTNYTGETATFSVSAVNTNGTSAGLSYQWKAGTIGSGVYSDLSNGGQISGATSSTLQVANVTAADQKDYVVRVFDVSGSVTSVPPAKLTVIDSTPLLVTDTSVTPNAVHAGNNNIINFAASMQGTQPIRYQWRFSTNADGSFAVNVAGATNNTYALSDPQESHTGYYSLRGSNGISPNILNSAWAQLTVLPASTAFFKWTAPVPLIGMTAAQILGGPAGRPAGAALIVGTGGAVTVGSTTFNFVTDGSVATMTGVGGPGTGAGTFIPFATTGDANFDAILDQVSEVGGNPDITLHNLITGRPYSVQLFALDNSHDPSRAQSFTDPADLADVSRTYVVGDNAYIIGTFVANNTDVVVRQVLPTGHGYFGSLVVRALPPTVSIQHSGTDVQVTWDFGTLLEADDIAGPWTTNSLATSPHTTPAAGLRKFFRAQDP